MVRVTWQPIGVVRRHSGVKLVIAAVAALSLLSACAQDSRAEPPVPRSTTSGSSRTSGPQSIVDDPQARLVDVRLSRSDDGVRVVAWWQRGMDNAIAISDDGFESAEYRLWTKGWYDPDAKTQAAADGPAVPGLLPWRAASLLPGVRGVVGGGDGATLFPFQEAARSTDGGSTWTRYEIPTVTDARAYTSGQVVLPDGRLLALLDAWSDDHGRPSAHFHGLYVSSGDDWSTYRPYRPTFTPSPTDRPRGFSPLVSLQAGHGVAWSMTWDGELYVSTDGAETFRQVPTR